MTLARVLGLTMLIALLRPRCGQHVFDLQVTRVRVLPESTGDLHMTLQVSHFDRATADNHHDSDRRPARSRRSRPGGAPIQNIRSSE